MAGALAPIAERLRARIVVAVSGCHEWTGYRDSDGYGSISVDGKMIATHRLAWFLANGPIPPGMQVLHHCDNPPCGQTEPSEAFPDGHLFLGTNADNVADKIAKGRDQNQRKTHCWQGHPFNAANTYAYRGRRQCRACNAGAVARYKASRAS